MENDEYESRTDSTLDGSQAFRMERFDKIRDILSRLYIDLQPNTRSVNLVIQLSVFVAQQSAAAELQLVHFAAGLLSVRHSIAVSVLEAQGISAKDLESEILQTIGYRRDIVETESDFRLKASPEVNAFLQSTREWRLHTGMQWTHTGHLLLGLVQHCNILETQPFWKTMQPIQKLTVENMNDFEEI